MIGARPKKQILKERSHICSKMKNDKNISLGHIIAKLRRVKILVGSPVFDVVFDQPPKTRKTVVPLVRRQTR